MSRLLPTQTNAAVERSDNPSVLSLDDDATRDVIEALSSETAYEIFRLLNETPATPSRIADQLGQSVQNVHYHLENLEAAGVIEVTDTCYSEKGCEMSVYVVSEDPTILFLGTEDDRPSLKRAFKAFASLLGPPSVLLAAGESISQFVTGE
ncbi:ArsR family transcriptional regulator [Halobellus sp. Atlit-38R]|jgi:DNA-binding transcriptional ArsR family regulator|uniref:ArsR/SmtB family transcription factor n=1 Tax=Halobellus sp. Atlit-38R TaxID=2282131 RepID=UPI000EF28944|nr:helix-turn-helix domain-containing protein [Halobellus sp. Atlit-38R]RLM87988.1 ArsR family transcriptional regulator [Halobellus sp. Atlit-38R]